MGQVPAFTSYLVIGDGRVARHFRRYFEFEALPFYPWSRRQNTKNELVNLSEHVSHVLLLISDRAIEPFLHENPYLLDKICVHMSGALSVGGATSVHPLMTFSDTLYELEFYRQIPFVIERDANENNALQRFLPGLRNPCFGLSTEHRVLYHALCVLAGNFTVLLWEKAFREFAGKFDLPKDVLIPYLMQTVKNLASSTAGDSVLTGPLARADFSTINKHLKVLENDPYHEVYLAFTHAFQREVHDEVSARLSQNEVTR